MAEFPLDPPAAHGADVAPAASPDTGLASPAASVPAASPENARHAAEALALLALTRAMTRGDEAAYRVFYAAYFDRLSRYLLVVTAGDEHATREALQVTLTRVVRHIREFSAEPVFWSWLTVLARSALADQRRQRRRYLAFLDRFTRHAAAITEAAFAPDPLEAADPTSLLHHTLEQHLHLLPSDERQLLDWKYREHLSVRAIAARLDTSEKAVESRLTRLRRKLKDAVLAHLSAPPAR